LNHTDRIFGDGNDARDFEQTTIDGHYDIQDLGQTHFGDLWLIGHYSYRILPWLIVGTNLKLRNEIRVWQRIGMGFGMDLGAYFNPMDHYRYGAVGLS